MEQVNPDDLYAVLAPVARNQGQIFYGQLSQRYYDRLKMGTFIVLATRPAALS